MRPYDLKRHGLFQWPNPASKKQLIHQLNTFNFTMVKINWQKTSCMDGFWILQKAVSSGIALLTFCITNKICLYALQIWHFSYERARPFVEKNVDILHVPSLWIHHRKHFAHTLQLSRLKWLPQDQVTTWLQDFTSGNLSPSIERLSSRILNSIGLQICQLSKASRERIA